MKLLNLIAFATALFGMHVAAAETQQWSCAKTAKNVPVGWYVKAATIAHNDIECQHEEHKVLLAKLEGQTPLLACDFQNIGTPAGYILRARMISAQCGCVTLRYSPNGGRSCEGGKMAGALDAVKQ